MKKVNIQFNFTNKFTYTFIATIFLILVGVGVFAFGTSNPSTFGHTSGEIIEADPTVPDSVKDGTSWGEITSKPSGFDDNVDNIGITIVDFGNRRNYNGGTWVEFYNPDLETVSKLCRELGYHAGTYTSVGVADQSGWGPYWNLRIDYWIPDTQSWGGKCVGGSACVGKKYINNLRCLK